MKKLITIVVAVATFTIATIMAQDVPANIRTKIRAEAAKAWPDDYSMQQYTIEEQIEAFQFLIEYEALGIPPKIFKKIKAKAAKEWDKDYAMQQYIIEEQVEAYLSVHPPEESPAGCPM